MAKYWVGGTGNWSDTTHWSASSGGAGSDGVPGTTDNVIFDSLSNATAYTCTVDTTANCADFTIGNPLVGAITFAGSSALNIYGSLSMASGMTRTYTGDITFRATSGTKTIVTNSIAIGSNIIFNGSGGTFQLTDGLTISSAKNITLTAGTFDPNSQTVSLTSTAHTITGNFTFANLTRTGTETKTNTLTLSGNQTITGTLTINGNSAINRILVKSGTLGTARTLTAGTVTVTNADLQDITGAGAGSWDLSAITGLSGDCGGNTGITFTTPVTTNYTGATGNFSTVASWGTRVPLPQDTATFTTAGTVTITQDMPRIGSINFTGSANKTWTTSTTCSVFGSINLTDLATLTASSQNYTFEGRGSNTLISAGKTFSKVITIDAPNGTLSLSDEFINTTTLNLNKGTLTALGNVKCTSFDSNNTTTRILNMGSGIWEMTGTNGTLGWSINNPTGLTLDEGTSTIKLTGALTGDVDFNGGVVSSLTYNNFWNATTGAFAVVIKGSNTFNDFKIDAGRSMKFTTGTTQTVTTFTATGTAGNLITIDSTTTGTHALVKAGGGTISCDYLNIQHSVATPANTWYAGTNSTNNQETATAGSGWIFTDPPAGNTSNFFMFFN